MDCLEMVLKCDDIRVLTTVAWGATSDLQQALLSEEMRDTKELVLRICDRARALLAEKESSNGVDVELAQYFAELCAVRCFLDPSQTSQAARAWSALTTIPRMKEQHLKAFVYWVKLAAPSLISELKDNLLQAGNVDVQGLEDKFPSSAVFGGADPMAAIFLVDRTWQPILDSTIDAVSMVFSDYINYHDRFGMYGLGDGWIVPLALKTSINIDDIESAKVCVGACILYKSMLDCLKVLSAVKGHSKWLVVLSDTVDLEERVNSAALAAGDSAVVVNPNNAGCQKGKILSSTASETLQVARSRLGDLATHSELYCLGDLASRSWLQSRGC